MIVNMGKQSVFGTNLVLVVGESQLSDIGVNTESDPTLYYLRVLQGKAHGVL
jgi:hypothetical protein